MAKDKSTFSFSIYLAVYCCVGLAIASAEHSAIRAGGNAVIGALVQVHTLRDRNCKDFDLQGILTVEAILYAIDKINGGKHLDLKTTVGYDIHETCPSVYDSTQDLVLRARTVKQNASLAAVLGTLPRENVDSLLLLLTRQLPIISCDSSSRRGNRFLDKSLTRFMFNAVPSDTSILQAIVDVMVHINLSYASVIHHDGARSSSTLDFLEEVAKKRNVCIAKNYSLSVNTDKWRIKKVIEELTVKESTSVVLLLTHRDVSMRLIEEASKQKATKITWIIGKESWDRTLVPTDEKIARRVIVVDSSPFSLSGFTQHLKNLQRTPLRNKWLREIVANDYSNSSKTPAAPTSSASQSLCSDAADPRCGINTTALNQVVTKLVSMTGSASCIIDAVFAVARALAAREKCTSPCSPQDPLYKFVREVDFTSPTGHKVSFSSDGYLKEIEYHIYTYQKTDRTASPTQSNKEVNLKLKTIGTWKLSKQGPPVLSIQRGSILNTGRHEAAIPYCTGPCDEDGLCKVSKKVPSREGCCWQCRFCLDNAVAAQQLAGKNNQTVCSGDGQSTTDRQAGCPKKLKDYVHWGETGSLILLFLIAFGFCFGVYVTYVLLRNRNSPVMRRARNATITLLPFILLIFFLPIPLLSKPSEASCETYRASFLLALGIPLAALIAKAEVVERAFYDCDGHIKENWKNCSPRITVLFLVVVLHIIIIVVIRMAEPAEILTLPTMEPGTVYIECSVHSSVSFPIIVFYLLVAAGLVSLMSLREASSPGNDFEVKWVSLSMFVWYALAFVYVALMFGMHGKEKILALGFVDFLQAANLFVCLYVPKWFIAVFQPEKNSAESSPWNMYMKTQEKVSLRLSSQGNESPVLSKREFGWAVAKDGKCVARDGKCESSAEPVRDTYV